MVILEFSYGQKIGLVFGGAFGVAEHG